LERFFPFFVFLSSSTSFLFVETLILLHFILSIFSQAACFVPLVAVIQPSPAPPVYESNQEDEIEGGYAKKEKKEEKQRVPYPLSSLPYFFVVAFSSI